MAHAVDLSIRYMFCIPETMETNMYEELHAVTPEMMPNHDMTMIYSGDGRNAMIVFLCF